MTWSDCPSPRLIHCWDKWTPCSLVCTARGPISCKLDTGPIFPAICERSGWDVFLESSSASLFRPTCFSPSYAKRLTSVGVRPYMAISIAWMWSWVTNSISGGSADEEPNLTFLGVSTRASRCLRIVRDGITNSLLTRMSGMPSLISPNLSASCKLPSPHTPLFAFLL